MFDVTLTGLGSGVMTIVCLDGLPPGTRGGQNPPTNAESTTVILGHSLNFTQPVDEFSGNDIVPFGTPPPI